MRISGNNISRSGWKRRNEGSGKNSQSEVLAQVNSRRDLGLTPTLHVVFHITEREQRNKREKSLKSLPGDAVVSLKYFQVGLDGCQTAAVPCGAPKERTHRPQCVIRPACVFLQAHTARGNVKYIRALLPAFSGRENLVCSLIQGLTRPM